MLTLEERQTRAMYEEPAFAEDYARFFPDYDEHFWRFEELLTHGRILDLGCGPANDGHRFTAWDYQYVGIDFAYAMLSAGRKWHKGEILVAQMDMAYLGFATDSFDGFWAVSSLMHVPKSKIEYVLRETHRVVKSNGIGHLLLREGNFERVELNEMARVNVLVSAYFPNDFSSLLEKNGFEILDFKEASMGGGKESMMYFVRNRK